MPALGGTAIGAGVAGVTTGAGLLCGAGTGVRSAVGAVVRVCAGAAGRGATDPSAGTLS
jgi:hypothetical protein